MMFKVVVLVVCAFFVNEILGHGRMMEPVNRSSRWRFNESAPANYDDDQNFCGGLTTQWEIFDGKCGVCGDTYNDSHPQANENTGTYGEGVVVRNYQAGSVIDVNVLLTTNHKGFFEYSICILEDPSAPETGEDCFIPLMLEDGSPQYAITPTEKSINNKVKLNDDIVCDRCVLRWHYTAGNNWGDCGNGTFADGCGPQETFRSCADVSISKS